MKKMFQSNILLMLLLTQPFFLLQLIYIINKHNNGFGQVLGICIYLFVSVISILLCKKVIIANGELIVFSILGLKKTSIRIKDIKSINSTCKGPKAYCFSICTQDQNVVVYPFFTKHYEELIGTVEKLLYSQQEPRQK